MTRCRTRSGGFVQIAGIEIDVSSVRLPAPYFMEIAFLETNRLLTEVAGKFIAIGYKKWQYNLIHFLNSSRQNLIASFPDIDYLRLV